MLLCQWTRSPFGRPRHRAGPSLRSGRRGYVSPPGDSGGSGAGKWSKLTQLLQYCPARSPQLLATLRVTILAQLDASVHLAIPDMLVLSREADYAVRLVVHMATARERRFQGKELAAAEHVAESFVFKILQQLVKQRLVRSFRGIRGGYQLAVDPARLTLYQLVETLEGSFGLNLCVVPGVGCEVQSCCAVHEVWALAQKRVRTVLEGVTIEDMARRTLEKRSAVPLAAHGAKQSGFEQTQFGRAGANLWRNQDGD